MTEYPNPYRPTQGGGCGRVLGNFVLLLLGGVLVLALVAMFLFWRTGDRMFDGLEMMFNRATPTPQVDVQAVVLEQVRNVSELNTVNQRYSAIIPVVQEGTVLMFVPTQTRLLYVAVGDVKAGIDLSQVTADDVQVISDTLYLQLPPPQIMDVSLDPESSEVIDYDEGFLGLGPDSPHLQSEAERRGEDELLLYACRSGIMDSANQQAATTLESLLGLATDKTVVVQTQVPPAGSCTMEEPGS